jgi:predicted DsbA family dithiol-disulfide isomerase
MALESPFVDSEMVEAIEFPDLANQYNVSGVPQTTINQAVNVVGAAAESQLIEQIKRALVEG